MSSLVVPSSNLKDKLCFSRQVIPGSSLPKQVHRYPVTEQFKAIEATSPPAEVYGRDTPYGTVELSPEMGQR